MGSRLSVREIINDSYRPDDTTLEVLKRSEAHLSKVLGKHRALLVMNEIQQTCAKDDSLSCMLSVASNIDTRSSSNFLPCMVCALILGILVCLIPSPNDKRLRLRKSLLARRS